MEKLIVDPMELLMNGIPTDKDKPEFEDNEKPNPIPLENVHNAYIDCLFAPIYKQLGEIRTELLKALNNE